jgi:hypothetical protein
LLSTRQRGAGSAVSHASLMGPLSDLASPASPGASPRSARHGLGAATAANAQLLRSDEVGSELGHLLEAGRQTAEQPLLEPTVGLGEPVEAPNPLPTRADEPRIAQLREMTRSGRLRNAEHAHEIPDAELSIPEDVENAESGFVRERAEQLVDAIELHSRVYSMIRIYSATPRA